MEEQLILTAELQPGIRQITLNRPEKRNALNRELLQALCDALELAHNDTGCRVIILSGAGPLFCAGLDLKEAQTPDHAHESAALVKKTLHALATTPQVTIAAVHKAAIAGGAGLMSACDLAVATEEAQIGYPEVYRGLVAGLVMHWIARQIGGRHARELLLLGHLIDGKEAFRIGLINKVVAENELMPTVIQMANTALKGAPGAISHTKRLLEEMTLPTMDSNLNTALEHHLHARNSEEAQEGMRAFTEKRLPVWDPTAEVSS